jgi:23S rRNA pseudouridine2605 synthase
VNGRPAGLGQRVSRADRIVMDGRPISLDSSERAPRLLLYHKRAGEIVSRDDPQGRPSVFERLPDMRASRWIAVGRLDFNTSGLLLFTDSGDLAHRLMHPRFGMKREYAARVIGQLSEPQKALLLSGVKLDDGMAHFDFVEEAGGKGTNRWYRVVLQEGRNREVRRLFEAVGMTVSRLMRVSFGDIKLPRDLRLGRYRELSASEVRALTRDRPDGPPR